jgi:hypothetical protein
MRHFTRFVPALATLIAVAAGVAVSAGAPAARAAQPSCATTQAFSRFGDYASYSLLMNATIEKGLNGFQYTGAPSIVTPNEKYFLHSRSDSKALQLAAGDSATFHAGCIPQLNPSMRFVARAVSGSSGSLGMTVKYQDLAGVDHYVDLGTLDAAGYADWAPSPILGFLNNDISLSQQTSGTVWLILTPSGAAKWQVDDLYIDPRVSRR